MIIEDQEDAEQTSDKKKTESAKGTAENIYKVQCFPLYSMLVAVGRTRVDYFSLDVEGSEYKILATIPWHKVDIKVCIARTYSMRFRILISQTFKFVDGNR
jgi:hypothetical protein